jgi:hypothetical protein
MTVLELIKLLETYDPTMQVISPEGAFYELVKEDEVQTKELYPDLTDADNSVCNTGEKETYLMITTNQFN